MVERAKGEPTPFNGADALALACEMYPGALTTRQRARLGLAAKELLDTGFDQRVIVGALYTAICLGRVHMVESIALDLQNAGLGLMKTLPQYRDSVERLARSTNPTTRRIRDALRKARP